MSTITDDTRLKARADRLVKAALERSVMERDDGLVAFLDGVTDASIADACNTVFPDTPMTEKMVKYRREVGWGKLYVEPELTDAETIAVLHIRITELEAKLQQYIDDDPLIIDSDDVHTDEAKAELPSLDKMFN